MWCIRGTILDRTDSAWLTQRRSLLSRTQPTAPRAQTTPAFVESPLFKDQGADFFATQVTLGKDGVEKIHPIGEVDASEQALIDACVPELAKNIKAGYDFIRNA